MVYFIQAQFNQIVRIVIYPYFALTLTNLSLQGFLARVPLDQDKR